jgi:hypothetical protein
MSVGSHIPAARADSSAGASKHAPFGPFLASARPLMSSRRGSPDQAAEDVAQPAGLLPRIYILGHALQYFATCLTAIGQNESFWKYIAYGGLAIQVASSAALISVTGFRLRAAWLYLCLLSYLGLLALLGLLHSNGLAYLAADILAFGLLLGSIAGGSSHLLSRLARFYTIALVPGLLVALLVLSRIEPGHLSTRFISEEDIDAFAIRGLCIPAAFTLLTAEHRGRFFVAINSTALALMGVYGWFTETRTELIIPLATLALAAVAGRAFKEAATYLVGILAVASLAGALLFGPGRLSDAASGAWERFSGADEFSAGRDLEAAAFYRATSNSEWLIGRGLGGAYWGQFQIDNPYGMNMVHFGHLHLILKGGVILLLLMSAIAVVALVAGFASRGSLPAGAASFVALFIIINTGHTSFIMNNTMSFFGLALGQALSPLRTKGRRPRSRFTGLGVGVSPGIRATSAGSAVAAGKPTLADTVSVRWSAPRFPA